MSDTAKLIDTADAAELLGLAPRTLMRWRVERSGPTFIRIGNRSVRYRPSDLDAWIEQQAKVKALH